MEKKLFYRQMIQLALPITIQSLLQATLSMVDQLMIGHLGSMSISGVGFAAKFISVFTVTVAAIVTVASIFIAQYKGGEDEQGINASFFSNLYFALGVSGLFIAISLIFPYQILSIYSKDQLAINQAAIYLKIMALGFIPQTVTLMLSAVLRNMGAAKYTTIASGFSVVFNTLLNYLLIFGIGIFPKMDVAGAAWATSIARVMELLIVGYFFAKVKRTQGLSFRFTCHFEKTFLRKIGQMLTPILICECLWSLGDNVYAIIYGRIGTDSCSAMVLTYPIQSLVIGTLSGVSAAAGIMVGNTLGRNHYEEAYEEGKIFVKITVVGAVLIGIAIFCLAPYYVQLYDLDENIKQTSIYILYAYAFVFCAKVINMVFGGGVLRSGGQTKYIMMVDIIGTWLIGVPIGFITAYLLKLPIYYVYLLLSLEEYIRVLLEVILFRSRRWMKNITEKEVVQQCS